MTIESSVYRGIIGQFATGVTVITTAVDGWLHGMTANDVSSVSLEPPLVLECVDHSRNSYPLLKANRRFAFSILSEDQRSIAEYYVRDPKDRVGDVKVPFKYTKSGSAVIEGSLAFMDCHVVEEHVCGDHTLFIAGVDEIGLGSGRPLLFFEGRFPKLTPED